MQEMQLHQGLLTPRFDGKGIERLRFLAMQFEGMGKVKAAGAGVPVSIPRYDHRTRDRLIVDNSGKAALPTTCGATQAPMRV